MQFCLNIFLLSPYWEIRSDPDPKFPEKLDPDPKFAENWDPYPKKINSDPQHYTFYILLFLWTFKPLLLHLIALNQKTV